MKVLPALLVASLAANAALVGVSLSHPGWIARVSAAIRPSSPAPTAVSSKSAATARPAMPSDAWSKFEGGSIPDLVARLNAAGFPDSIARAVGRSVLADGYRQKRNALLAGMKPVPYWKGSNFAVLDKDTQKQINALNSQERDEAKALGLNGASDDDLMQKLFRDRQYGNLSEGAISKIQKIQQDYQEMRQQMLADSNGRIMGDQMVKMNYLNKEMQADIAKELGPDDYETFELHSSPTSFSVRQKLSYFDPTEQEYKEIFDAQSTVDSQRTMGGMITPDQQAQQKQLQAAADQQIAAALGPDRYADYVKETNPAYAQAASALTPLNVPQATIDQVYTTAKATQDQITGIRQDPTLSPSDRQSQIAAATAQASASLSSLLGNDNFQAYKQQAGWLNSGNGRNGVFMPYVRGQ